MALKKKWVAYTWWLFGGFAGTHLFYLGRDAQAFAMWCTFGGGLGIGWLTDLWKIPAYVAEANEDEAYTRKLIEKMQKHPKPPFSLGFFASQIKLAYFLGLVYYWAIPIESIYDWDLTYLRFLTPIPVSLGVWLIGNTQRTQGRLKPAFYSACLSFLFSYANMPGNLFWLCLSSAIGFNSRSKEWRRTPLPKKHFLKRVASVFGCGLVYMALVYSALYFNAEITDSNGVKIKFRNAVGNLVNSPLWEEFKDKLKITWNHYKAHGWSKVYADLLEQLDPHGEKRALKTLGLSESATKPEIVARFRALSKEWHPDRHKDPDKKQEAHLKFMEFQDAYQKLIKIRGKVKAAPAEKSEEKDEK